MMVYTDGSCGEGVVGLGWKVVTLDGDEYKGNRYIVGDYTSMEAEYFAMLDGLRQSRQYSDEVVLLLDCRPLITKMRIPDGQNEVWYLRRRGCHRLLNKFESWEIEWTPRKNNTTADRLASEALEYGRRNI